MTFTSDICKSTELLNHFRLEYLGYGRNPKPSKMRQTEEIDASNPSDYAVEENEGNKKGLAV